MIYLGNNPIGLNQNVHFDGQDEAAFLGLALAAGDTTQINSDNNLGEYTEEAKIKIQKMLGIYEAPWELINEETFTHSVQQDKIITIDKFGNSFELTDAIILFETPKQDTESAFGTSGGIIFGYTEINGLSNYGTKIEIGQWTQAENASAHGGGGAFLQHKNLIEIFRIGQTTPSNTGGIGMRYGVGFPKLGTSDRVNFSIVDQTRYVNKITIMTVLGTGHYKLYGKRKIV